MYISKTVLLCVLWLLLNGCRLSESKVHDSSEKAIPVNSVSQTVNEQADKLAASQILIVFQGAVSSGPEVTRTKAEALEKAKRIAAQLQESPEQFGQIAQEESDGLYSERGGYLGEFAKGTMVKPFEEAVEHLAIGEITVTPVETDFGYFIIRREEVGK